MRPVPANAPQYVKDVLGKIMIYEGDDLPVSALSVDGTYPSATTQWEKRNITLEIPVWEPDICIQCGKCSLVCPHGCIRQKVYHPSLLAQAPETFKSVSAKFKEFPGDIFTLQVSPEDCTGCGLCVENCPVKSKTQPDKKAINLASQIPLRESENKNWEFFMHLPDPDREQISFSTVKNSQLLRPLFEFSGACAGCGETPYVKLLSQLFGDHALIANATGCSSVYGGSLPTTPWAVNDDGRGPAWSNSLFEDNAEFGLGMLLTTEKSEQFAREIVQKAAALIGERLVDALLNTDQTSEVGLGRQRANVAELKNLLQTSKDPLARQLAEPVRSVDPKKCVDCRWRWLGLRYWFRRAGSRVGFWPEHQCVSVGYRSLFKHRWASLEGDAKGCNGKICSQREGSGKKRSGDDCDELRQYLCRKGRHGRE
jgi:pyruvate-ferredoxin/flavodoxin oxidoreductase